MLGMLNSDKLDIVIGRTSVSQNAGNYDYVHLAEEDVSIVAGNGNPLTQQKKLALSDLKDARWLAYPHRAPLNILLKQELERADINTFTAPVETASTFVTITLLSGSADFVALIPRSEAQTSELQSLMRISYAVFCLQT